MGIFSEWQPQYQAHGIPTFPVRFVGKDKKPAVTGYLRTGSRRSAEFAAKFPDSEAFGLAVKPNRLTILDVDTNDERILTAAMDRHGASPFIVRSGGSGNYQAWYRNNGERRRIKPDPRQPIDVLGDGYVVAPPSKGTNSAYQIIQGTLEDLKNLPTLKGMEEAPSPSAGSEIHEGTRDDALWRHLMGQARYVDTLDELIDIGRYVNEESCIPPLPDAQVIRKAKSAWEYQGKGENWFGTGQRVVVTHDIVDSLAASDPFAFALLGILRRHHEGVESFYLAKPMADSLGWTLRRWKAARDALVLAGIIRCIHPGGGRPNDPPKYAWGPMGCEIAPQY